MSTFNEERRALAARQDDADAASAASKQRYGWMAMAAVLAVVGILSTMYASRAVARNDVNRSHDDFERQSAELASKLELALQHEEDLIINASGFVAKNPEASNAEFREWAASVQALDRYPELEGFGYSILVPAAELPDFARRAMTDPSGPVPADGVFQPVPPGERQFYCFVAAGARRFPQGALPAGFDLCAAQGGPFSTRDSGERALLPLQVGEVTRLSVAAPVYLGGVVPSTVQARRENFVAWVGMTFSPDVVLARALQGHEDMALSMRYHNAISDVVFHGGSAPPDGASTAIALADGWTAEVSGPVVSARVIHHTSALLLLVAGVAASLLFAALVLVLGTGRARAWRLVKARTAELRYQALHDPLTGLPNRALIADRIEQLLARCRRNSTEGAALFVDLDEFKSINDTLGHEIGDRLLVAVAVRLRATLRDVDTIGRMGGDEFVVLIDSAESHSAPALVATRLLEAMRDPFLLPGVERPIVVNASVGIAAGDRETGGDLLRDADLALYRAKAAGKNCYESFVPEMHTAISHRLGLEFELRSALERGQFRLVYQPIYSLDDMSIVGVEALLRWDQPERGTVQPDEFIPILEQSGQIREVGRWVLMAACTQMAAWRARGHTLDLSVNVSGRQLDDDGIIQHIREALTESGLDARSLIVEVTETALMRNVSATARRLRAIKEIGVRIAVDDFGTGYSSLAYLQQFPVDCLKIDRAFTSRITTSRESKALIGTLVQLGRDLGLKTLAEGVETEDQLEHLRGERVDEAQGFLLARPFDAAALETQILEPMRPGHIAA